MHDVQGIVGGILAGGYAKRLRPLTDTIPKPLIEIKDGYTILDRQLRMMGSSGIGTVYLMVGHLKEKIKGRYGDRWRDIEIRYIEEEKPMGTVYGIRELLMKTDSDVVIMNGDVVTDVNLSRMIDRARSLNGQALMFITKLRSPFGIVELVGDRIASFREKPLLDYYINGGVYVIPNELKGYFERYERGDVERLVFPALAEEGLLFYHKEEGVYWRSIDSLKDLDEVRKEFESRVDEDWGYRKDICRLDDFLTEEVYVMKGRIATISVAGKSRILTISGRGLIQHEDMELNEGEITPELAGILRIVALENLKLQLYEKLDRNL